MMDRQGQVGYAWRVLLASFLVGVLPWIVFAEPPAGAVNITSAVEWSDHGDWHSPRMFVRNGHLIVHAHARATTSGSLTRRYTVDNPDVFNDVLSRGVGSGPDVSVDYPHLVDVVGDHLYVLNLDTTDAFPSPDAQATLTGIQTNVILYDARDKSFRNLTHSGLAHREPLCMTRALRVFHEEGLILVERVNISLVEPVGEPIPASARTEFLRISDGGRVPLTEGPARARAWLADARAVRSVIAEERADGKRWVVWTLRHGSVDGDPVILRRPRDDDDRDDVSPSGCIIFAVDPERRLYVAGMRGAGTYLIDFSGRKEKICDEVATDFDEHSNALVLRALVERGEWRRPGDPGFPHGEARRMPDRYRYWILNLSPWLRSGTEPKDE